MSTNTPHTGTLEEIQRITDDEILTEREVWDLADYLNEDEEVRTAWPGKVLFGILREVFEGGVLTNEEMQRLAEVLSEVEHQAAEAKQPVPAESAKGPTLSMDAIKVDSIQHIVSTGSRE
ncbi:MAG: hypothetical protein CMO80_05865 [Verrucomicrobiales bacterium]|nr:hypothetical protein [Verrucomicrobiales bacterium]